MGHRVLPVDSCGCHAPAEQYPSLSSGLLSVIPDKVWPVLKGLFAALHGDLTEDLIPGYFIHGISWEWKKSIPLEELMLSGFWRLGPNPYPRLISL